MIKLETLANENKHNEFNNAFDKLKSFIFLKKERKEFFIQINMLGFNKKHLVISTWENLINDDNIKSEEFDKQIENDINQVIKLVNTEKKENRYSKLKPIIDLSELQLESDCSENDSIEV